MELACPQCEHPNWVGLRFCTCCGVPQRGFAIQRPGATLTPIYQDQIPLWTLDERCEIYPVFGELVFVDAQSQAWILSAQPGAKPRALGPRSTGLVEVLAVDRWLVMRAGHQLHVLAAPLLRTPRLHTLPELMHAPMPSETAARLVGARNTYRRAKIASVARLGTQLAVLVATPGGARLRVMALDAASEARSWEAQATVVRDDPLPPGTWHFERGATIRGVALVAASHRAVVLLRARPAGGIERLLFELPPTAGWLRPGSAILTRHGIVVLTEANDAMAAWLLHDPEAPPLRIIAPAALEGLEPQLHAETVTVMARAQGQRHRFNHLVPRFEVDPVAGAVSNRIEEELPGGVLYRADDWAALRLRSPTGDTPLRLPDEPRGSTVRGAIEGQRLWVLSRREGRPGCGITALDWV